MNRNFPVMSLKTASILKDIPEQRMMSQVFPKNTYYDRSAGTFLSEISDYSVIVKLPLSFTYQVEQSLIQFNLQPYSAVYEMSSEEGSPSALLKASNLPALLSDFIELTDATEFVVPTEKLSPILIGNRDVIQRLVHNVPTHTYTRFSGEYVTQLVKKG